jgi:thiol-disulfide isomerase/thioredoxin
MKPFTVISVFVLGIAVAALTGPVPGKAAPAHEKLAQFTHNDPPLPAPETEFLTAAGKPVTMAQFKGKVVLVNFWATWCAPCVKEMPSISRLKDKIGSDDFAVVAISEDRRGADVAIPFLKKHGIDNLTPFVDTRMILARGFRVVGMPTTYLIDRQGRITGSIAGAAEWDSDEAVAMVRKLLARK